MTDPAPPVESTQAAFDRGHIAGHTAGEIAATLSDHAQHLAGINGSQEKTAQALELMAARMEKVSLQLQRLADQAEARDATVIVTAAALKDAEAARRNTAEQGRSGFSIALAGIGAFVAVATLALGLYLATRPR